MAHYLEDYINRGLRQIVVVDYRFEEKPGTYGDEYTNETVLAYDGTKYVEVKASEVRIYAPRGSDDLSIGVVKEISETEYRNRSAGIASSDSTEALDALAERRERKAEQARASKRLDETRPNCPVCGNPLTYRHGRNGWFFGCQSYPSCRGTASFTTEQRDLWEVASKSIL